MRGRTVDDAVNAMHVPPSSFPSIPFPILLGSEIQNQQPEGEEAGGGPVSAM